MRNESRPANGKVVGKASQVGGTACAKALVQEQASGNREKHCGHCLESGRRWCAGSQQDPNRGEGGAGRGRSGKRPRLNLNIIGRYGMFWSDTSITPTWFLPQGSNQRFSQCGPQTSSISIAWNALESQILGPHPRPADQTL